MKEFHPIHIAQEFQKRIQRRWKDYWYMSAGGGYQYQLHLLRLTRNVYRALMKRQIKDVTLSAAWSNWHDGYKSGLEDALQLYRELFGDTERGR